MTDSFNRAGVKAAIHHVARRFALQPERLGSVKFHKILWYTEITLLRKGLEPLGEAFRKYPFGPFATHLEELGQELVRERLLTIVSPLAEYDATLYVGKGTANRPALSIEQWSVVDQIANRIVDDHSANSISERSHGKVWEATELYREMLPVAEALIWRKPSAATRAKFLERLGS